MLTVSLSNSTAGPLARAVVAPFSRPGRTTRFTLVQARDSSGNFKVESGPKLKNVHFLNIDSTSQRDYRAAVQDADGVWSEWSDETSLTLANYTSGSDQVSIGSGVEDDLYLIEPSVRFPLPSMGSGKMGMHRTIVSAGFSEEVRYSKWAAERSAFRIVLSDLDQEETLLLHRFYRALNGPRTPFLFDWADPHSGDVTRYTVRFRDPTLADTIFDADRSEMEFTLVEVMTGIQPIEARIDTQFSLEIDGNTVESSSRWDLGSGASAGMTFDVAGGYTWVEIGTAHSYAVHTTGPASENQRGEISFDFSMSHGTTAYSGVVLRYVDDDNYILCRVSHVDGREMELIERIGGSNTVLGTIPYDPDEGVATATYVGTDTTTQGDWIGVYGADGYKVVDDSEDYPDYATVSITGEDPGTFPDDSDVSLLQTDDGLARSDGYLYSETDFTIDLDLDDGLTHQVAIYSVDLQDVGYTGTIQILRASDDVELDSRTADGLFGGKWFIWRLRGHVKIKFTATNDQMPISGIFFDTASASSSIRCEVVGRRARAWYETIDRPVMDRPPDIAANLSQDAASAGEWGIYMEADAANEMRITRFQASDLSRSVLPPPHLSVAGASGPSLAAVAATVSGVTGSAEKVEWQVLPADPDDFPEAYSDLSASSLTSRKFMLRPGYTYDVRAREHLLDGSVGEWGEFSRIVVTGTKVAPSADSMPSTEFPDITPSYVLERSQTAEVQATISDRGVERVKSSRRRPRNTFTLVFDNRTVEEYQILIDFFESARGAHTPFAWTHPTTGTDMALRFAKDDYDLRYESQNTASPIASVSFEVAEIVAGISTTLSLSLEAEHPAL